MRQFKKKYKKRRRIQEDGSHRIRQFQILTKLYKIKITNHNKKQNKFCLSKLPFKTITDCYFI